MKPDTITHWDCIYCSKGSKCIYHYDYNKSNEQVSEEISGP